MKVLRKIIEINNELCDGCGQCVPSCAEGALEIIDGKAKIIADKFCDGLGACLGECPQDALKIIEKEVDEFDEEAVEEHLGQKEKTLACGCPGSQMQSFCPSVTSNIENIEKQMPISGNSSLSNWPIQIKLIPPTAPFLKNADLLVLADCTGVAHTSLHSELLKGKVVMMGCPKLDDKDEYIERFKAIFIKNNIKSITTLIMEVPCCSGLPVILKKALDDSGQKIPLKTYTISPKGKEV